MHKNVFSITLVAGLCLFTVSCSANKTADENGLVVGASPLENKLSPVVKPAEPVKMTDGISSADFRRAVQSAVHNMLRSGALDSPTGERYVITVSRIVDTTKKGFDTQDIISRIKADLSVSRKVRVVSANAKNVTPQINISGRITQRTAHVRSGKRQEYYLHLVLTDVKSGLELWDNVTPVVKKKKKPLTNKK